MTRVLLAVTLVMIMVISSSVSAHADRGSCDAINGTPYESANERAWFWQHCIWDIYGGGVSTAAPPQAPAAGVNSQVNSHLVSIRWCESGDDYSAVNPVGYYGAYQFDLATWASVGGAGYPHYAPAWEQDMRAQMLYNARGSQPWPVCQYR